MKFEPSLEFVCANDFINQANTEKVYLSKTKLLKLVYFFYGHYYASIGNKPFEENFLAWPYGPVVKSIYVKIRDNFIDMSILKDKDNHAYMTNKDSEYGLEYFRIFDYVWDKYKDFSAIELTSLSHADGSPWSVTKANGGTVIDPNLIQKYFKGEDID